MRRAFMPAQLCQVGLDAGSSSSLSCRERMRKAFVVTNGLLSSRMPPAFDAVVRKYKRSLISFYP